MSVGIPSWDRPRFYPSVATTLVVWEYPITSRPNYCSGASSHHLFTSQYYSNLNFFIIWEVILFINFNLTYINVKKLTLNKNPSSLSLQYDKFKKFFLFIKDLETFVQHQTDCSSACCWQIFYFCSIVTPAFTKHSMALL